MNGTMVEFENNFLIEFISLLCFLHFHVKCGDSSDMAVYVAVHIGVG